VCCKRMVSVESWLKIRVSVVRFRPGHHSQLVPIQHQQLRENGTALSLLMLTLKRCSATFALHLL
jgi:hypothetical protein